MEYPASIQGTKCIPSGNECQYDFADEMQFTRGALKRRKGGGNCTGHRDLRGQRMKQVIDKKSDLL